MDLFTHTHESTKANTAIYNEQKERLSVNAWIILFCLLEGQYLCAIKFVNGIQFDGMIMPKKMCEYRRRCTELKVGGIEMMHEVLSDGSKLHWIPQHLRADYIAKYNPYKAELLAKINKA